jgi:hypothetical protein
MAVDRNQVIEYFVAPVPKREIGILFSTGFFALMIFVPGWYMKVVGLASIAWFAWTIYSYKEAQKRYAARPSDSQMDAWLEEDLKLLDKKALDKLNIDESEVVGEGVVITGPRLYNFGGAGWAHKRGNDNILRYTPVDVCVINFTQNQLVSYTCALDLTTGNAVSENTDEYFYKDVVSVATKTESRKVTLEGKVIQMNAAETFSLTTSGGTSISVMLSDPTFIEQMGGGTLPTTRAEKAINNIRKMLREKKA